MINKRFFIKWVLAFVFFPLSGLSFLQANTFAPTILFDTGGRFDKSFGESAYRGAEKFKADFGKDYRHFEIHLGTQREQSLRRLAQRGGSPIVAVGFSWKDALKEVAPDYPDTYFTIIDAVVDEPNVRSVVFKEHEGSYLVGILAAMASKTKKLGFIGGMDIPLIRKFSCGYKGGALSAGAKRIIINSVGVTTSSWLDPIKGGEIAQSQMARGVDVIYAAAGSSGLGALQAVAEAGKLGVGVDSNQNWLHPGNILTSMIKRVDLAVYNSFKDAKDGKFTPGVVSVGLKDQGLDYSLDEFNKGLISEEMLQAVEKAREDIISGQITVHDYMSDNNCPY